VYFVLRPVNIFYETICNFTCFLIKDLKKQGEIIYIFYSCCELVNVLGLETNGNCICESLACVNA
jgi:hypothetical protein